LVFIVNFVAISCSTMLTYFTYTSEGAPALMMGQPWISEVKISQASVYSLGRRKSAFVVGFRNAPIVSLVVHTPLLV